MVLLLSTANQSISVPAGDWTAFPGVTPPGTGTAGAANAVRATAFYKWYAPGDGPPTTSDSGSYQAGVVLGFNGVDPTNPFRDIDVLSAGASNTQSLPSLDVVSGDLICQFVAGDRDIGTSNTQFRDDQWLCSAVSGGALTEIVDEHTSQGNGGGVGFAYGEANTTGAVTGMSMQHAGGNSFPIAAIAFALRAASSSTSISPADAAHTHAAASPTLAPKSTISPSGSASLHTASSPSVAPKSAIAPASSAQATTATSPSIAAHSVLDPDDAVHVSTASSPSLGAPVEVAPDSAAHPSTAAEPSLAVRYVITAQSSASFTSASSPALETRSVVAPNGAAHALSSTSPTIAAAGTIAPSNAEHEIASISPSLATAANAAPAIAQHLVFSSSPTVGTGNSVAPASTAHAQLAGIAGISAKSVVSVDRADHLSSAASPDIGGSTAVQAANAHHNTAANSPSLAWHGSIAPHSAAHLHLSTSPLIAIDLDIPANRKVRSAIASRWAATGNADREAQSFGNARSALTSPTGLFTARTLKGEREA